MVVPIEQQKKVSEDPEAFREQIDAASAAQGALADTALQPTDLDALPDVGATALRLLAQDGAGGAVGVPLADLVERQGSKTPYASALVDDSMYSHFPVIAKTRNGHGILYHRGRNHGQSDLQAVCLLQTPAAGGVQNLIINGNEASGGAVVLGPAAATQIVVDTTANDTARVVTVTGTLDGVPVVRSGNAGNNTQVTLAGNIDTITSVTVDGNTVGQISIGLLRIASDMVYRWSNDGFASKSDRVLLGDGMSDGSTRFYYPALGTRRDGSVIAVFFGLDVPTGVAKNYQRTSFKGENDWTPLQEMVVTGPMPTYMQWYGQIKTTKSGRLIAMGFTAADNYQLISDDDGATWTSSVILNSVTPNYSEIGVAVIDERNWLALLRIDSGVNSMGQLKTADGGASWTSQGETNIPTSGGYKSPELFDIIVDGVPYVVMLYAARQSTSLMPPTPDAICMRWAQGTRAQSSALNWNAEVPIVTGLAPGVARRSGYPSMVVNDDGIGLLAYGDEPSDRAASVLTKRVDVAEIIRSQTSWTPTITFSTPGDLSVTYAMGGQTGRIVKRGRLVSAYFVVITSAFTYTTAAGQLRLEGLPYASSSDMQMLSGTLEWSGITKAGYTQIVPRVPNGASPARLSFRASGSGVAADDVNASNMPSGGTVRLIGAVHYIANY